MSLDNALLEEKAIKAGMTKIPKIEVMAQAFPYVPDRLFLNSDPVTIYGSFYLVLIPLSVFMILYEEIIREKMNNLRIGLHVIGCSNAAFWISWMITGVIFSAIMSVLMICTGYWFGFDFFTLSPFYILFLILFLTSIAYVSMAAALTTVMTT